MFVPEEEWRVIEFVQDGSIGIGSINTSLIKFEPKTVFAWHCSIMIHLKDVNDAGLPLNSEREVLNAMEDQFIDMAVGADSNKPNGLFLARLSWNRTTELIWRVCNPEPMAEQLQSSIDDESYGRPFEYRIDFDEPWALAEWHLRRDGED